MRSKRARRSGTPRPLLAPSNFSEELAEWLKNERIRQDVSIETLAWTLGYTPRTLARWEAGESPRLHSFVDWVLALGLSPSKALQENNL